MSVKTLFASLSTADEFCRERFGKATFEGFDSTTQWSRACALHDRLIEIGFGPQAAPLLFGVADMTEIRANRAALYEQLLLPKSMAGKAARFFVLHQAQSESELREWLGRDLLTFLTGIGAIARDDLGWRAIAGLTWFGGRLIFTDARMFDVVWSGAEPFADYVMPPGRDSIGLLRVAPRKRIRKALLDICCGAGTQALAAADYSERIFGVDINPRALRFAQFNAAANGIDSTEFILGNVYDGVPEMRFDAMLSNPPFVPWPQEHEASLLFRGGGARGEDVIARIFAGAAERLEPHGMLSMVADFVDAVTLPQRLEQWQGSRRQTLILLQQRFDLIEYAEGHSGHLRGTEREAQVQRLVEHLFTTGIRTLDFGYVVQSGSEGDAHIFKSDATARQSVTMAIEEWFEAQERRDAATGDASLSLMPGLRTTHNLDAGAASFLPSVETTETAQRIIERIARGQARTSDFDSCEEMKALNTLLDLGFVQIQRQSY